MATTKYQPKHRQTRQSLASEAMHEASNNVRDAQRAGYTISFHEELRRCKLERGLKA